MACGGVPHATFHNLEDATAWVERWAALQRAGAGAGDEKLAAVFDVDATLLRGREGEAIEPVCALFHACRDARLTPFVVTARSARGRTETVAQLARVGIDGYKRLYMHPEGKRCATTHDAGAQKLRSRMRIESHGYRVCVNAGDAWHDHWASPPRALADELSRDATHVFVTGDGVAHLKLPG